MGPRSADSCARRRWSRPNYGSSANCARTIAFDSNSWTVAEALLAEKAQEEMLANFRKPAAATRRGSRARGVSHDAPILATAASRDDRPAVVYRRAGDKYVLVEYGPLILDIELRLRVHALMLRLQAAAPDGILDLTPGIRSLQVHYDNRVLPLGRLLELLHTAEQSLAAIDEMQIATRIVKLPLSWDDESTQLAIAKYMQSVRADAPWCPSNIEFIRRVNGLSSVEDVKRIVFDADYLVLGLGDVYLGAPVTTPLDPRHRLVTTKYNPARTWTPENAVGIGGAYLCVYGMEGPGGYQFVGRTCQMWNTYRVTAEFAKGKPQLLRFFRSDPLLPGQRRRLAGVSRRLSAGPLTAGHYRGHVPARRVSAFSRRKLVEHSCA